MGCSVCRPLGAVLLAAGCGLASAQPVDEAPAAAPMRLGAADPAAAETGNGPGRWRILVSPWAPHYRYSIEHQRVWALGLERRLANDWLAGAAYFRNSFGQPSGYAYLGRRSMGLLGTESLFFQWSAGVLYGYRGEFKDKVPLNFHGFAPGALVTLGWQFGRHSSVAVHALGDAGLMFQFAYDLP
ncbi:MAG: hypothetical protein Q7S90_06585 [Rubrivivax sp.]|nr:hypothetical protein [Rubrivivax sp.]